MLHVLTGFLRGCAPPSSAAAPGTGSPSRASHWHGPSPHWGRCLACGSTARPRWSARPDGAGTAGRDSSSHFWRWQRKVAWHPVRWVRCKKKKTGRWRLKAHCRSHFNTRIHYLNHNSHFNMWHIFYSSIWIWQWYNLLWFDTRQIFIKIQNSYFGPIKFHSWVGFSAIRSRQMQNGEVIL